MFILTALMHLSVAGLIYATANWAGLIPWRRAASAHWAERARLLWPARVTAQINIFLIPGMLYLVHATLSPETGDWWITDVIAAFFGVTVASYYFDREIFHRLDFHRWWRLVVTAWAVQFGTWVPFIVACLLMPETIGVRMLLVGGGYLAIHFAMQWGLQLKFLRWVKYLTPAEPRLQRIIDATAARLNVAVRAAWQSDSLLANAYAFTTTRELVFTNRLLEICNDEEVAAICEHELGHLNEPKMVLVGRLFGSLQFFPLIFMYPSIRHFETIGAILPLLGMLLIAAFARGLSRRMEKRADEFVSAEQHTDGVYARALEKLYRENQIPAVTSARSQTHPHLYDRMTAAGITPDFPRPTKPNKLTLAGWVYVVLICALLVLTVARA